MVHDTLLLVVLGQKIQMMNQLVWCVASYLRGPKNAHKDELLADNDANRG